MAFNDDMDYLGDLDLSDDGLEALLKESGQSLEDLLADDTGDTNAAAAPTSDADTAEPTGTEEAEAEDSATQTEDGTKEGEESTGDLSADTSASADSAPDLNFEDLSDTTKTPDSAAADSIDAQAESSDVGEDMSDDALNELLSGFGSGGTDSDLEDLLGDGAYADSVYDTKNETPKEAAEAEEGGAVHTDEDEDEGSSDEYSLGDGYEEISFDDLPDAVGYEEISFDDIPDEAPYDDIFSIPDGSEEPEAIEPELPEAAEEDEESNSIYDLIDAELDDLDQFAVPDMDVTPNVEVYEAPAVDMDAYEEIEEEETGTPIIIYIILGVLAFCIITVAIVFGALFLRRTSQNAEPVPQEATVLSKPEDIPNNLNFLYVNEKQTLGDKELLLTKVLIDPVANVFYFDNSINVRDYEFTLYDSQREIYGMDLSYMYTQLTSEDTAETEDIPGAETVIRFEPFLSQPPGFTLEVTDIATGDKIRFSYVIAADSSDTPVKYYNEPIPIDTNLSNIEAVIENATFSSAGSIVNYKISWSDGGDTILKFGDGNTPEAIAMEEKGRRLDVTRDTPLQYSMDDNTVLGRVDFSAVTSLNSEVKLIFEDALMSVNYDKQMLLAPLFADNEESQVDIDLGGYKLVLERAGIQGDYYVLVFHAENKSIAVTGPDDVSNRVESNMTAQLRTRTAAGAEIVLEGVGRVSPYGTDMIFNRAAYAHLLSQTGGEMRLDINSIDINLNDISLTMDLKQASDDLIPEQKEALDNIKAAFNSRLAYKSGTTLIEGVAGFTTDVLTDPMLMQNYEPQTWKGEPVYTSQILSYAFDAGTADPLGFTNDPVGETLDAIVQETWKGETDEAEIQFYRTHKVKCERRDNGWTIVKDELIN